MEEPQPVETVEMSQYDIPEKLNRYLKLGWIIVMRWVTDYGEPGVIHQIPHILLGWTDRETPAQHPPAPKPVSGQLF
jgi:hypothetical protein